MTNTIAILIGMMTCFILGFCCAFWLMSAMSKEWKRSKGVVDD